MLTPRALPTSTPPYSSAPLHDVENPPIAAARQSIPPSDLFEPESSLPAAARLSRLTPPVQPLSRAQMGHLAHAAGRVLGTAGLTVLGAVGAATAGSVMGLIGGIVLSLPMSAFTDDFNDTADAMGRGGIRLGNGIGLGVGAIAAGRAAWQWLRPAQAQET